ncbi:MAG: MBL fold metallo-hydrolase [Deltaproteobacteria bacterium]|nr:MBL fold metallo-hydrolase [Deltaproteobacteria bacterium]
MTDAPEPVGEGVWRLALRTPTLPPATHTNTYLVGGAAFLVVEPGSPFEDTQARLAEAVSRRIAQGHRFEAIVVTHHHPDHVGGVGALQRAFGVPLWAHPETARKLQGALSVDRALPEGDEAVEPFGVRALHTPGHAPGHLCLRERQGRWTLVGDMVASVGTILIDTEDEGDMEAYLSQLRRLADLGPGRLLPAHGDPVDDGPAYLQGYVRHRLAREARVYAAVAEGGTDEATVAEEAYREVFAEVPALALRSTLAHLERLRLHGRVRRDGPGRWRRA